jgi:Flp pilus assembly protein TadG
MPESVTSLFSRFARAERGNIAILFAAAAVPLLLLMGGVTDFARFTRYKAELSNAVDSAALALARRGETYTEAQAKQFVTDYVAAFNVTDADFAVNTYTVTKTDNGFHVVADASMSTIFLSLAGMAGGNAFDTMSMNVVAEVVHASNRVELALVLDNTGSMNCGAVVSSSCTGNWSSPSSTSRIAGLKTAAHTLIDTLMTDDAVAQGYVKVSVVPFEGTVNIKNAALDYAWLDWNDVATAKYNGKNFDDHNIDPDNDECTETTTGGSWHWHSYSGWHWHAGGTTTTCTETDEPVGHKWLFDQLNANDSSVTWAGCVEMRADPYDLTDTAPDSGDPDTLFVPFFWPDEPDDDNDDGDYYSNNYLNDRTTSNGSPAQKNTDKFTNISWQSGKKDTSFPYTSGPNYGCPRPVLPLTSNRDTVEDAIDDMVAYPAMGTYIPTGLIWGWHALSPGEPLVEGVGPGEDYYEKTVKAIVLLSDGENSVTGTSNHNDSIFSGYNYIGLSVGGSYRLGSDNTSTAQTNLNTKTSTLCTNVKADGIRLYTITFGDIPTAAQTLMQNCASVVDGETLYYHAPSNAELEDIFYAIGEDLSDIHLSM